MCARPFYTVRRERVGAGTPNRCVPIEEFFGYCEKLLTSMDIVSVICLDRGFLIKKEREGERRYDNVLLKP